jgi:hypothetical protein
MIEQLVLQEAIKEWQQYLKILKGNYKVVCCHNRNPVYLISNQEV